MEPYLIFSNNSDNIITMAVPPIKELCGYCSVSEVFVEANKRIYSLVQ